MNRQSAIVLAIDPGLVCGWTRGVGLEPALEFGQYALIEMLDHLYHTVCAGAVDRIVCERFDPRRWDNDTTRTVEAIGAIRWLAHLGATEFGFVNAGDKQRTMPSVSKNMFVGFPHAADAEAVRLWDLRYGRW